MTIKETLLELRREYNISQQALANATKISQSTIAKIEIGRNEATASTIRKLAEFFNVSTDYLLGRTDELGGIISPASPTAPTLSPEEQRLLKNFRAMRPDLQKYYLEMSEPLMQNPPTENSSKKIRG